jgi:hypothetical protein
MTCGSRVSMKGSGGQDNYFSSRIAAFNFALSSGVTSRIPCCLACSAAFFSTSSSVFPRTTCVHPDAGCLAQLDPPEEARQGYVAI